MILKLVLVGEQSGEQDRRSRQEESMAPRKSSQRRLAGATRTATAGITTSSLAGTWAFKFSGYVTYQVRPWWLTGLGKFTISTDGKLKGEQRSAIMPIQGQEIELEPESWRLKGTILVGN